MKDKLTSVRYGRAERLSDEERARWNLPETGLIAIECWAINNNTQIEIRIVPITKGIVDYIVKGFGPFKDVPINEDL